MNLKIKYSTIGKACIILMLLVHVKYFYLINIEFNRTLLMSYLAIISMFFSAVYVKDIKEIKLVLYFLVVWLITLCRSIFSYNNSVSSIYTEAVEYLTIFSALSIYLISKRENSIEWIENIIIIFGTIVATILTVHGLILAPRGINFFDIDYAMRLNGIRFVNSTEPILFGSIFAFARLIRLQKTSINIIKYGYVISISTIELLFVSKTRALIIIYLVTLSIMLWNSNVISSKKEFIRKIIVFGFICLCVFWGLQTNIAKAYFNEYNTAINTQYDTVLIRKKEVNYAIEELKKQTISLLFGTGFVKNSNTEIVFLGNTLKGIRSDIGLIGFINEFGIMGAIWFSAIFIKATKVLLRKNNGEKKRVNYIGIYSVFILGIPTLFLFNGERLVYFSIWLGIMMYYDETNNRDMKDNL